MPLSWGVVVTSAAAAWLVWPVAAAVRRGRPFSERGRRAVQRRRWPSTRVLIVGDSSGAGGGAAEPRFSVAGRLAARHPEWNIGNLAHSGCSTADVARLLGRLARRLQRKGPGPYYDAIVIHTGANDALRFTREGTLSVALVLALAAAGGVARHAVLVTGGSLALAPAFPAPWSWLFGWRGQRIRELFQAIAWEAGVECVDLYVGSDEDSTVADTVRYFAVDGSHPSDGRHALWLDPVDRALTRRLEGTRRAASVLQ